MRQCLNNVESICRFVINIECLRLHPSLPIFGVFIPAGSEFGGNFGLVATIARNFLRVLYNETTYLHSRGGELQMKYLKGEVPPSTVVVNLGAPDRFIFPGLELPDSWTSGDSFLGGFIYLHNVIYVKVLEWLYANERTVGARLGAIDHEEWIRAYEVAGRWFTPP